MSDITSLAAIAIALASFIYSVVTSREVRAMNRREHEWEQSDRISAHIEVTRRRRSERTSAGLNPGQTVYYSQIVRLRNTGQAPARDVDFEIADPSGNSAGDLVANLQQLERPIPTIHPGEAIDLYLVLSIAVPVFGSIEVRWNDDAGAQRKSSIVNL